MLRNCLFIFGMFCASVYAPPKIWDGKPRINSKAMTLDQFKVMKESEGCSYNAQSVYPELRPRYANWSNRLRANPAGCGSLDIPAFVDVNEPDFMDPNKVPQSLVEACSFITSFQYDYDVLIQETAKRVEQEFIEQAIEREKKAQKESACANP